ncbi:hypothetical protein ON010_g18813 [Phytophthora cinnamomi]|nr:hypothetical protein ON010_g18813 [Phytophthora cinnamomi]
MRLTKAGDWLFYFDDFTRWLNHEDHENEGARHGTANKANEPLGGRCKDPDDVFHFMELDIVDEYILSNPKFTAWAKYVDDFSAKYPTKQVSMVPVLLNNYDDVTLFGMAEAAMRVEGTVA